MSSLRMATSGSSSPLHTAHCITKPLTKSYFHNKYFRGHASKCVSLSYHISAEHAESAVAFSRKRNLFEICSPVNVLIFPEKLGHRETTCKFSTLLLTISSIIYIYMQNKYTFREYVAHCKGECVYCHIYIYIYMTINTLFFTVCYTFTKM